VKSRRFQLVVPSGSTRQLLNRQQDEVALDALGTSRTMSGCGAMSLIERGGSPFAAANAAMPVARSKVVGSHLVLRAARVGNLRRVNDSTFAQFHGMSARFQFCVPASSVLEFRLLTVPFTRVAVKNQCSKIKSVSRSLVGRRTQSF
jgi:hypothetical protein